MNKATDVLTEIESLLHTEGFDCSLHETNDEMPFDMLLLFLGNDSKQREKVLSITCTVQENLESLPRTSDKKLFNLALLQFQINLNFDTDPDYAAQTAFTLLFMNKQLELAGFEFDETFEHIRYRYGMLYELDRPNKEIVLSIVGSISMTIGLLSDLIEEVATGKVSFDEMLAKIESYVQSTDK